MRGGLFWGGAPSLASRGRGPNSADRAEIDELDRDHVSEEEDDEEGDEEEGDEEEGDDEEEEDGEEEDDDNQDDENNQTKDPGRARKGRKKPVTAKRRPYVKGGLAVLAKPITIDYDSDDARLIELKQQDHTDVFVAETFQKEGRMRYSAKTVGSRWQRLRKMMIDAEDEELDDELSDWHVGEDDKLKEVFDSLEQKYKESLAKLEQRKWQEISMHLGHKIGKRKYSAKACRERFVAVQNGTALTPIEEDEDQEGRRELREARITAAKKARQDAKDSVRQAAEAKKARQEAAKREKFEAEEELVSARLQRKNDKRERELVKEERNLNRTTARRRQQAIQKQLRAERDWRLEKKHQENEAYRTMTGKSIDNRPRRRSKKNRDGHESEEAVESNVDEFESDEEGVYLTDGSNDDGLVSFAAGGIEDQDDGNEPSTPAPPAPGARRSGRVKQTSATKPAANKPAQPARSPTTTPNKSKASRATPKQAAAPAADTVIPVVTKETLRSPRSILSGNELDLLLVRRGLPGRRPDESHAELVARLDQIDKTLTSNQLEGLLKHANEPTKGKKVEKIQRLQEADAKKSEAGQMGVTSTDLDFMQRYEGYSNEFRYLVEEAETEMTSWWGKDSMDVGGE
ncbi:Hypothetical predicted protein [Lecanosticta acicola]|uniref:DUF7626 domain-containing protein n=1 Tax=Lecanosticta acicola TaxID=111012 RepID=A0AAI8Z8Y9_9PEZI|nr:Hypothetical predicted protein [Lecanosticta acicola]